MVQSFRISTMYDRDQWFAYGDKVSGWYSMEVHGFIAATENATVSRKESHSRGK